MDDEEWKQLLLALRHLAQCRDSTERACRFADELCSRAPETQGSDRHVRSRRARLFPKAREVFAVSLSAFLFFQRHSADRTFARFIGLDLGMHRAGVNGRGRFHFIRLLFHRVGSFLHRVRRFLHLISDSFLFWLSNRPVLHPRVAFHLATVVRFGVFLHLHALVLHPLHTAVLHAGHVLHVVLHFFCAFGIRLRHAQLLLYCECRFITGQEIARCFGRRAHLRISRITRWQWRRICDCATAEKSGDANQKNKSTKVDARHHLVTVCAHRAGARHVCAVRATAAELVKPPEFHWRSGTGLLRQQPRAVCGSLRVVAGSPPIAGDLLLIDFALPPSSPLRFSTASVHGQRVPFGLVVLPVSVGLHARAPSRQALLRRDDVPRCVPAVVVQIEILYAERGRLHKRCKRRYR